jgi:transcriptional regulator with XRE-family HTH domain
MTQALLAENIGVSRSAIAQWERAGGSIPSASNLCRLAVALRCSFEWLATGRGARHPTQQASPDEDAAAQAVVMTHFARDDSEAQLLNLYRDLDEWDRQALMSLGESLSTRAVYARRRKR